MRAHALRSYRLLLVAGALLVGSLGATARPVLASATRLRPQAPLDLRPAALVAPAAGPGCYSSAEALLVRVQNAGTNQLNFAANPATVTVTVSGSATQVFTVTLSTGTLAPGATTNLALPGTLNMTPLGTYTFGVTATVVGDQDPANNNLSPSPTRTVTAPTVGVASAVGSVCSPSGSPTLAVSAFSSGSLQWESSPTGLPTSFTPLAGSTNQNPFVAPSISATTHYRARVTCGTSVTSNVVTVSLLTTTTWTGNLSNSWFTPGNWTGCVPNPTLDVVIPAGRARYPLLLAGNAGAHHLTIAVGASLTQNADTLEIQGNLVSDGLLQLNLGVVRFNGPAQQQAGGTSLIIFRTLMIGASSVTLTGPVQLRRVLTLTGAGNLNLAGQPLTLLSDALTTAMVVNANTGAVVGNTARVQRFLTPASAGGASLGYRHFGAPISNATIGSLQTPHYVPIVNATYNTAPNPQLVVPYPNVFGFDESRFPADSDFVKGYYSPVALTDPLVVGKGYTLYMRGTSRVEFVGTLANGDVSQGLTQTGGFLGPQQKSGWHLLSNPYPSPLEWDSVTFPVGMSQAVSVFSSTGQLTGLYRTRVNGVGPLNGGDGKIAMCQGYFVRVFTTIVARPNSPQATGYTTTNLDRTTTYTNPPHRRPTREARPIIGLTLRATGATAAEADQAWVYFQAGATDGFDLAFDGSKPLHNPGMPTILSLTAVDELAINGLPATALLNGTTIPLLVDLPAAGSYTFEASDLLNVTSTLVVLLDQLTGTRYDLASQPSVTFTVSAAGETRTRFVLEVGQRLTGLSADAAGAALALYPNPTHDAVRVRITHPTATVQLLNATGRVVRTQHTTAGDATLSLTGLPAGLYAVRVGKLTQRLVVE